MTTFYLILLQKGEKMNPRATDRLVTPPILRVSLDVLIFGKTEKARLSARNALGPGVESLPDNRNWEIL
jgi:hypothetical protein